MKEIVKEPARTPIGLTIADKFAADANLDIPDVALWSGLCVRSVYEQIRLKKLKARKLGRRTVVRARDALEWRDSAETVGA